MIKEETVLILGAGASKPFGYPTGFQLLKKICENLSEDRIRSGKSKEIGEILESGYDEEDVLEFSRVLSHSGKTSVDAFLEHRPEFVSIGKYAIAQALIPLETNEGLNFLGEENWYRYLFGKLNAPLEDFLNNEISIITFNYDRSLEHYLFTVLKNSYNLNEEKCAGIVNKIPIVHLYGQLDYLPWQNRGEGRSYSPEYNEHILADSGSKIKIMTEEIVEEDQNFKDAWERITKAKWIYFIGFGYNEDNLSRLKIQKLCNEFKGKAIRGTTCGLGQAEKRNIDRYFKDAQGFSRIFLAPSSCEVYQFFKDFIDF